MPQCVLYCNTGWLILKRALPTYQIYFWSHKDKVMTQNSMTRLLHPHCNILMCTGSVNTWASEDSPLAQLVKELDLCLFLCVKSEGHGINSQQNQSLIFLYSTTRNCVNRP